MINEADISHFRDTVWSHFETTGRHDLPWRQAAADGQFDAYAIMVSELMLQQTQVSRVVAKFSAFMQLFPTAQNLAQAELGEVLAAWSGLGYNRRAKFLWQAAKAITNDFHGVFPRALTELVTLPGVGKNTAGAILVYAFNQPVVFIETNIRTVYIHHFFQDQMSVPDGSISELVAQTLDTTSPREWYWALMDYGSYLKKASGNASRQSRTYTKQSRFHGSRRQIRGQILKSLTHGDTTLERLGFLISDERLESVLNDLVREGLIQETAAGYRL